MLGKAIAQQGYAVVVQSCRGRYGSEGDFYPQHPDVEDGYDTVEWAAAQPWSNGKVAMYGLSYSGMTAWAAAIARPPHLVGHRARSRAPGTGSTASLYSAPGVFTLGLALSWSAQHDRVGGRAARSRTRRSPVVRRGRADRRTRPASPTSRAGPRPSSCKPLRTCGRCSTAGRCGTSRSSGIWRRGSGTGATTTTPTTRYWRRNSAPPTTSRTSTCRCCTCPAGTTSSPRAPRRLPTLARDGVTTRPAGPAPGRRARGTTWAGRAGPTPPAVELFIDTSARGRR